MQLFQNAVMDNHMKVLISVTINIADVFRDEEIRQSKRNIKILILLFKIEGTLVTTMAVVINWFQVVHV